MVNTFIPTEKSPMQLFYDTETTGFTDKKLPLDHPDQPRIVQLGAILDFEDGREAMRFDVILNHDYDSLSDKVKESWTKAATIHGITPEMSASFGVTEEIALELFFDMLCVADIIVGHNIIGFDNAVVTGSLRRVLKRPDVEPFKDRALFDTMQAGKAVCRLPSRQGGFKNPTLTELHKHFFNEGFSDAHQAISDVLATRRCFYKLQELVKGRAEARTDG